MSPVESFYVVTGFMLGMLVGVGIGAGVFLLLTRLERQEVEDTLEQCTKILRDLEYNYSRVEMARLDDRPLEWYEKLTASEIQKIKDNIDSLYKKLNEK